MTAPTPNVDDLLEMAHRYARRAAEQADIIGADGGPGAVLGDARRQRAHDRLDAAARLSAFAKVADTFATLAQSVVLAGAPRVEQQATGWAEHVDGAVAIVVDPPADPQHDPECESEYIAGAGHSPCQCARRAMRARLPRLAPQACAACRQRDRGDRPDQIMMPACTCSLECGAVSCAGKTPPVESALWHYLAFGQWPDGTKNRLRVVHRDT